MGGKMRKAIKGILLTVVALMLAGCVSSRGFKIDVPQGTIAKPNGMQVFIRQITDNRDFQLRPSSPNIPSFGSKRDIGNASIKCRTVGRQRNGYGKAMRNVFLDENQKIETVIYDALKNSLNALGYEVVDSRALAKNDAIIMDVSIDRFWSWINIGAWTLRMDAEIKTTLTLGSTGKQLMVIAESQNHCQTGSSANWRKTIRISIENYIQEAQEQLRCLPDNC